MTLDRDQARRVLDRLGFGDPDMYDVEGIINDFAACVRPVAGVTFTPEEATAVRRALQHVAEQHRQYAQPYALPVDVRTADLLNGVADRLR